MSVRRLEHIPGFSIDRVAAAAGDDPDVLRLENLDTDVPPPSEAMEATRAAIGEDEANSWLPFTGRDDLKDAVAAFISGRGGPRYDGRREIVVVPGEGVAMLDALYAVTDPGDEVILTDPTYAGMINRVRLVGAVPRLAPLRVVDGWWRLDTDALRAAVTDRTRAIFVNNASFPSGWVASREEWEAIVDLVTSRELWLVYWATYEGVLFDGLEVVHPAAFPGMRDRTITVGDVLAEQRMIGWRIGWVVAPGDLVDDVARVHIYSGLLASGFAQIGARVALELADDGLAEANAEWQRRRDETFASSRAFRLFARRAAGRSSWTSQRLDWMLRSFPVDCSRRRSPRRRCLAGAARSPIVTSGSCSATSPCSGSRSSATASAEPSAPVDRE
jgi:aspartate/methionine/tyrosine aminotransferase